MDNTKTLKTELDAKLQEKGIKDLYIVGIATDVCVLATVEDALGAKTGDYTVTVVKDSTAAVLGDQTNYDNAIKAMETAGATVVLAKDVLAMCASTTVAKETSTASSVGPVMTFPDTNETSKASSLETSKASS